MDNAKKTRKYRQRTDVLTVSEMCRLIGADYKTVMYHIERGYLTGPTALNEGGRKYYLPSQVGMVRNYWQTEICQD